MFVDKQSLLRNDQFIMIFNNNFFNLKQDGDIQEFNNTLVQGYR